MLLNCLSQETSALYVLQAMHALGATPVATVEILRALGFDLNVNCIRIPEHAMLLETRPWSKWKTHYLPRH